MGRQSRFSRVPAAAGDPFENPLIFPAFFNSDGHLAPISLEISRKGRE